jgi:hypothetical protein
MLIVIQCGAFSGLLPSLITGPSKRARAVAYGPVSEDKEICPSKHAKGKEPDNEDEEVHLLKCTKGKEPDDKDEEVCSSKHAKGKEPACSRADSAEAG